MYDWPSRTPRNVRGSARPMRGSATLTTVESRNTIPDPSTAAVRIQRERLMCTSEIPPAEEVFQHPRAGCLVEGDAMAAWQHERGAWAHRDLEPVLAFQSALLQLGSGLAQVVDAVNVDRSFAFEVVGEEHMRRTVRQLDHRHPRAHSLDRERELAAKHVGEEPRVGRDIAAGRVQIVELEERRQLPPLAIPKKRPRRSLVLMAGRIAASPPAKSTAQSGRLGIDCGRGQRRPAGWAAAFATEGGTPWAHSHST